MHSEHPTSKLVMFLAKLQSTAALPLPSDVSKILGCLYNDDSKKYEVANLIIFEDGENNQALSKELNILVRTVQTVWSAI